MDGKKMKRREMGSTDWSKMRLVLHETHICPNMRAAHQEHSWTEGPDSNTNMRERVRLTNFIQLTKALLLEGKEDSKYSIVSVTQQILIEHL